MIRRSAYMYIYVYSRATKTNNTARPANSTACRLPPPPPPPTLWLAGKLSDCKFEYSHNHNFIRFAS